MFTKSADLLNFQGEGWQSHILVCKNQWNSGPFGTIAPLLHSDHSGIWHPRFRPDDFQERFDMTEWMVWLKTGIPAIDADHERIVKLITLAQTTPTETASKIINADFLKNTKTLIKAHFEREEDLMFSLRYKYLNDHITDHSIILTALNDITKRFECGIISLNEVFERILLLDDHKKFHDVQLAEFINNSKSSKLVSRITRHSLGSNPMSKARKSVHTA